MSWLWETERDERPRSSGLRLVLLGGFAPLMVIAAVAGVMLASPGATGRAGVAAEAQTLDCALPRNAWRSSCQSAAAAGPAAPASAPTVDESSSATGALPRKTGRASTKAAKPDLLRRLCRSPRFRNRRPRRLPWPRFQRRKWRQSQRWPLKQFRHASPPRRLPRSPNRRMRRIRRPGLRDIG